MAFRDRIKEFRRVPVSELQKNPANWREHPAEQRKAVQAVLDSVGIVGAVLAYETSEGLRLIDGHLRTDLDPKAVWPVLILDCDENEANFVLATFDPLAAMADSDKAAFASLAESIDVDDAELQRLLKDVAEDIGITDDKPPVEITEDEPPQPPADPITKPGDVWLLGEHRLLCGDSTNAEDVARLMNGRTSTAVVTDPPYGIAYSHGGNNRTGIGDGKYMASYPGVQIEGDDKPFDPTPFLNFDQVVLWGANHFADRLPAMPSWLVWDKRASSEHTNDFADCEIAWTNLGGVARMFRHQWDGMIKASEHGERREHPTQKPIALMSWCIQKTTGIIFDPFAGSGTTLIAAEQLGRACFAMEISPAYCDVVVKRWEKLTGREARKG